MQTEKHHFSGSSYTCFLEERDHFGQQKLSCHKHCFLLKHTFTPSQMKDKALVSLLTPSRGGGGHSGLPTPAGQWVAAFYRSTLPAGAKREGQSKLAPQ